jgi:hypothetical protein
MAQLQLPQDRSTTLDHSVNFKMQDTAEQSLPEGSLHPPPDIGTTTINAEQNDREAGEKSKLLSLPNEVQLNVASYLSGSNAMPSLTSVNKHIHSIVNSALARNIVIHEHKLSGAVDWLLIHEAIIASVITVEIRASQPNNEYTTLSSLARTLLQRLIYPIDGRRNTSEQMRILRNLRDIRFQGNHQVGLISLLFTLCPNIKAIKIPAPAVKPANFPTLAAPTLQVHPMPTANPDFHPVMPLEGVALEIMQGRLQSLTIIPRHDHIGPPKCEILHTQSQSQIRRFGNHVLTFQGFTKLEYLDVSMDMLGLPHNIQYQGADEEPRTHTVVHSRENINGVSVNQPILVPVKILPSSLTHLRLRSCNKNTFALLRRICRLAEPTSQVKQIDLYLGMTAREIIFLCLGVYGNTHLHLLAIVRAAERRGTKVSFYSGENMKLIDMPQELTSMFTMGSAEAAMVALAGRQFSEVKKIAIARRPSSSLEHRLVMRHAITHFDLFNSETFDVHFWKGVAFFHGAKSTKDDPAYSSNLTFAQVGIRANVRLLPKRQRREIFHM